MFIKKVILIFFTLINLIYSYEKEDIIKDVDKLFSIMSDTHEIRINNYIVEIDMRQLLLSTAMIESNFGRDNYKGRVAKTYMQIEESTAIWYMSKVPELKNYLEEQLGRQLIWDRDEDAVFVSYIIYLTKIQVHYRWIDRFSQTLFNGDVEWFIYKLYYNSIKGASKYTKWQHRVSQLNKIKEELI